MTRTIALATLAVAWLTSGCRERGADLSLARNDDADCSVIARFVTEPNGALLADLERMNAVEIELLGAITDDLRVYRLHVVGVDDDCMAAIERLRRDERVRSIERDRRRELHENQFNAQGEG